MVDMMLDGDAKCGRARMMNAGLAVTGKTMEPAAASAYYEFQLTLNTRVSLNTELP